MIKYLSLLIMSVFVFTSCSDTSPKTSLTNAPYTNETKSTTKSKIDEPLSNPSELLCECSFCCEKGIGDGTYPCKFNTYVFKPTGCDCELCENGYRYRQPWYSINTDLYNATGSVGLSLKEWDCSVANEYLYFLRRAIDFLVELDENSENAITQIRAPNEKTIYGFNGSLVSIVQAYVSDGNRTSVFRSSEEHFFVQFLYGVSNQDMASWLVVEFTEKDNAWVVYDVYDYVG